MTNQVDHSEVPRWMYLLGIIMILFVIYVWQAPLDWFVEFIISRFTPRTQPASTP